MAMRNAIEIGAVVVFLGMCLAVSSQRDTIADLQDEKKALLQNIEDQKQVNAVLNKTLEIERQAIQQQQVIYDEIQKNRALTEKHVRNILQAQPCAHVDIDRRALERLQQSVDHH